MDGIDAIEYRDLQPGFPRLFLDAADNLVPLLCGQGFVIHVENGAHTVFAHGFVQFIRIDSKGLALSIADHADFELRHLANFFFQGHLAKQFFHRSGGSTCRRTRWSQISPQKRLAINVLRPSVIGPGRYCR